MSLRNKIMKTALAGALALEMLTACSPKPDVNVNTAVNTPIPTPEISFENACELPEEYTDGPFDQAGNDLDFIEFVKRQVGMYGGGTAVLVNDLILSAGHVFPSFFYYSDNETVPEEILLIERSIGDFHNQEVGDIQVSLAFHKGFCIPVGKAPEEGEDIRLVGGNLVEIGEEEYEWKSLDGIGRVVRDVNERYFQYQLDPDLLREAINRPHDLNGTSGSVLLQNNSIVGINVATNEDFIVTGYKVENIARNRPDIWELLTKENTTEFSEYVEADGIGILGEYYSPIETTPKQRLDPNIDFGWNEKTPEILEESDQFSVLWRGYLLPEYTGTYGFCMFSDDIGILYLDGEQIFSFDWGLDCIDMDFLAGEKVPIELQFEDKHGYAEVWLQWEFQPYFQMQPIPQKNFMPPDDYNP